MTILKLSLFTFFLSVFSFVVKAQNYQLLPDSCSYCFFQYYGGSGFQDRHYGVYPDEDTTINGETYTIVREDNDFLAGVRQEGDRLYGIIEYEPYEQIIMDWSGNYGDTLRGLYSYSGYYYDAILKYKGEVITSSGEVHRYQTLQGIQIYYDSVPNQGAIQDISDWILRWDEKALCGRNVPYAADDSTNYKLSELSGGLYYGYAQNHLINDFYQPLTCTGDTIYDVYTETTGPCQQCQPVHPYASIDKYDLSSINIFPNPVISGQPLTIEVEKKQIDKVKILDLHGKLVHEVSIEDLNKINIDHSFDPGVYMVFFFQHENVHYRQKLIVK